MSSVSSAKEKNCRALECSRIVTTVEPEPEETSFFRDRMPKFEQSDWAKILDQQQEVQLQENTEDRTDLGSNQRVWYGNIYRARKYNFETCGTTAGATCPHFENQVDNVPLGDRGEVYTVKWSVEGCSLRKHDPVVRCK